MPIFAVYLTVPEIKGQEIQPSTTKHIVSEIGTFTIKWFKTCHIEINFTGIKLHEFQFCRDSISLAVGYFREGVFVKFVIIDILLGTCVVSPCQEFLGEFNPRCINHPVEIQGEVIQLSLAHNKIVYLEINTGMLYECQKTTYAPPLMNESTALTIASANGSISIENVSGFFRLQIVHNETIKRCYRCGGILYTLSSDIATRTCLIRNSLAKMIS
jgi:hypothetical protein